ncbi:DEAD-box ATP-dependent RNA helicase 22 isoform X1 [Coffea eugenioides]|uniref:DEAD-box ATP-dependent RNA helicase 22 isoform X1 n=1 Tax=Coffea eugenioides TaxID=49369 RepID=UPI000F60FFE4|nr:DEAD-box ATP-dependent RNA helicase 22 isoform X1 [Coffea eugenioides]XP_027151607.1 DEAD-box ATP-dependent RNA helicase 22 isoform X1 [Coffea eugenioides]
MILQHSISFPMLHICRFSSSSSSLSPNLILPLKHSFLRSRLSFSITPCSFKTRSLGTAAAGVATAAGNKSGSETFFAEENVSWASLGVSDLVARALSDIGLHRPSLVQAACIPRILSGADTVVAAETGSGKTHGYLVPLFDMLCRTSDDSVESLSDRELGKRYPQSLVLCPNVMLCGQIVQMANNLRKENEEPLLRVAAVCGHQGWPVHEPDIIVSTPVALLNYLYAVDLERCRRSNFIRGVKYVVFDEADMLLCGGFQNQVIRLIHMLRFDEKQLSRMKSLENENTVGLSDKGHIEASINERIDMDGDFILENDERSESDDAAETLETEDHNAQRKDWRRVRKTYERSKQYIFVAATLPMNGKKTAGEVLKRMYPEASWVTGNYVHRHNPRLEQKWIEVTADTQVDALISAVNHGYNSGLNSSSGIVRTIVFANTVEAVEAVSKILTGAGIECFRYHSDSSLDERTRNLLDFQQKGGVFVCTDAAARGLDVPNISHVIQAEFATSAVDFLHRVGRTARAGQPGLVTSLYTEANRDLVSAIRQAEKQGLPVEKAFSRKRSFRNKLKKSGLRKTSVHTVLEKS